MAEQGVVAYSHCLETKAYDLTNHCVVVFFQCLLGYVEKGATGAHPLHYLNHTIPHLISHIPSE